MRIFLGDRSRTDDIVKIAVLKFFGDEPNVREQFLLDLTFPEPPAPAPEILFEILRHLREFSQIFYGIFASLAASYIFHQIHQKRENRQLQKELEESLRRILQENKDEIITLLNHNRELGKQFAKIDLKKHYIRYTPGMKEKWEIRLKIYGDGAELLLDSKETPKRIIEIFNQITFSGQDATGNNDVQPK
ncbi:MAG: hypothetical protein A2Z05_08325 [Chloroflexi bacterium RBG_16_60_22]|nr:MAG: hypothetical protein A2Z05_08325 [Chloroflexi bacterium RBG_16_60_22]